MEDGYREDFLGVTVALPGFNMALRQALVSIEDAARPFYRDHIHYSVATDADKRWPVVAALNIDQGQIKSTTRKGWRKDRPVGYGNQLGPEYYDHNRWDKGHIGSRAGAAWGDENVAQRASDSTMVYSNAALQLDNFNRGEWKRLEDWVRNDVRNPVADGKISVFSGPICGDDPVFVVPESQREPDQAALPAEIPSAFFKIVCFKNEEGNLEARAFILPQDRDAIRNWNRDRFEQWLDEKTDAYGPDLFNGWSADQIKDWRRDVRKQWGGSLLINNQVYQTTIAEIEQLTGLVFPANVADANPLKYNENTAFAHAFAIKAFPERIAVNSADELIALEKPRKWMRDDDVDVFITAAHPHPLRGKQKWISIQNMEPETINLDGWTIKDSDGNALSLSGQLSSGQSKVLKGRNLGPITLGAQSLILTLWNDDDDRIDRVRYNKKEAKNRRAVFFRMRISEL